MGAPQDDWQSVSPLLVNPQGDAVRELTDIKATYGFTDDEYLYLMLEFYELAQYHHLDIHIDFNGDGHPEYAVCGFVPGHTECGVALCDYVRDEAKNGEFEIGYRKSEIGSNAKEIFELKVPLWFFENKTEFYVSCSLAGQFNGECYPINETDWARVTQK